jgi:predicted DNA-binding protein
MQVQLATKISIETAQALDVYAKKTGKSKASIVEQALREFMKLAPTEGK